MDKAKYFRALEKKAPYPKWVYGTFENGVFIDNDKNKVSIVANSVQQDSGELDSNSVCVFAGDYVTWTDNNDVRLPGTLIHIGKVIVYKDFAYIKWFDDGWHTDLISAFEKTELWVIGSELITPLVERNYKKGYIN